MTLRPYMEPAISSLLDDLLAVLRKVDKQLQGPERLWRASAEVLPPPFKIAMELSQIPFRSKRKTRKRVLHLLKSVDSAARNRNDDDFAPLLRFLGSEHQTLVGHYCALENIPDDKLLQHSTLVRGKLRISAEAFRHAADNLGLLWRRPSPSRKDRAAPADIANQCRWCWRTGFTAGKKAILLCSDCRDPSKKAATNRRSRWKAPDQDLGNHRSFMSHVVAGLWRKSRDKLAIEAQLPPQLLQSAIFEKVEIEKYRIDFPRFICNYPHAIEWIERILDKPFDFSMTAHDFLNVIDPISEDHQAAHEAIHDGLLRNQKFFVERVIYLEAHEMTKLAMAGRRGGKRVKGCFSNRIGAAPRYSGLNASERSLMRFRKLNHLPDAGR